MAMRITLTLAIVIGIAPRANAQPHDTSGDVTGLFVHGEYMLGRNLSPTQGASSNAYVSELAAKGGFVALDQDGSGVLLGASLVGLIGHNDGTTRDPLFGGFLRLQRAGVFAELGVLSGFIKDDRYTRLFDLHVGLSLPIDLWAPTIGLGLQVGQTRDDGFVAILGVTLGVDRYFTFGSHPQKPRGAL